MHLKLHWLVIQVKISHYFIFFEITDDCNSTNFSVLRVSLQATSFQICFVISSIFVTFCENLICFFRSEKKGKSAYWRVFLSFLSLFWQNGKRSFHFIDEEIWETLIFYINLICFLWKKRLFFFDDANIDFFSVEKFNPL